MLYTEILTSKSNKINRELYVKTYALSKETLKHAGFEKNGT